MAADLIFASRVMRLALVDGEGATLGRIADVVLIPASGGGAPRVVGFVATVQRRRIFVNAGRVGEIDTAGVRLRSAAVDVRHFETRPGEVLASTLLDRLMGDEKISDLALREVRGRNPTWEVVRVALVTRSPLRRRRAPRMVSWREVPELAASVGLPPELAAFRAMHPSDAADALRRLPLERRRMLAQVMEDERLADLLEELPEDEQLRMVEELDLERLARVLVEMDPDDAVDLLAEMAGERQRELLAAMPPDEAAPLRRLLRYGEHTAGGLMTPEPVILSADTPVAMALARVRDPELTPALAAQVFVTDAPLTTPTGRYRGSVGIQRLLREPPGMELGRIVEDDEPTVIAPNLPEAEVAARLASYNLLAVPVCDEAGRLLGAVSVDDVLDAVLPEDWRMSRASGP